MRVLRRQQTNLFDAMVQDLIDSHTLIWDPRLKRLDELLEDETLVELVYDALGRRRPQSRTRGRRSTPAETVLRLVVLKHLNDWTFEETAREVGSNVIYRQFTRIGMGKVPGDKAMIRLFGCLDEATVRAIHERIVQVARERKITRGRKMRVDTTVVESNIHYPTDSSLMADGIRVVTRLTNRLIETGTERIVRMRNRTRAVGRRLLEISRAVRNRTSAGVEKKKEVYKKLIREVRATLREAKTKVDQIANGVGQINAKLIDEIERYTELTERVIEQAKLRIFGGNDHAPDKLVSLFEPETEIIRKGKASKPTEFGKMVKIQEAEGQIITDFEVYDKRPWDSDLLVGSVQTHIEHFGRAPTTLAADAAFFSLANEQQAERLGVKRVAIPNRRTKSKERKRRERERWFRKAQAFRTGSEGRISVLKRGYGMGRSRYKGVEGMKRCVGFGVIACNLWTMTAETG